MTATLREPYKYSSIDNFYNIIEQEIDKNNSQSTCRLFDELGLIIQLILIFVCMTVLLFKKLFEKEKRDWLTFLLDVSKLIYCQSTQHIINLFISYGLGENVGLECELYIINILTDCTINVLFQYILYKAIVKMLTIRSGEYFDSNGGFLLFEYLKQSLIWIGIVFITKIFLFGLLFIFKQTLFTVAYYTLLPLKENPKIKLFFSLIIIPLVLNTFQYLVTDDFLKYHHSNDNEYKNVPSSQNQDECERFI